MRMIHSILYSFHSSALLAKKNVRGTRAKNLGGFSFLVVVVVLWKMSLCVFDIRGSLGDSRDNARVVSSMYTR